MPTALNALIGREQELDAVRCLLARDDVRLVTLTGPGGVGKTRIALAVAADIGGTFDSGVAFVPLAPIRDATLVPAAIAARLEVQESSVRSLTEELTARIGSGRFLLVLDNFEHLLAAAPLVTDLLLACPGLQVLTTSRRRLDLSGEHEIPVPPLALADPSGPYSVEELGGVPAIQLFVARAQAAAPSFALTEGNGRVVAEICQRLDGLPLAIELAAPRTRLLSPAALLSRLTNRLQLLTGGPRDVPERLQTMRQTIAWSYDLLDPPTQTLLRQLAVFVGGFTLEAAEWVSDNPSVLDLLAVLVDESLLRITEQPDGERRFGMLETVREYTLERLTASGEDAAARDAHAAYFLALAERAEPELQDAAWMEWVDRLVSELPNLRAALSYWRDRGNGEGAVRLAGALGLFWTLPAYVREGRAWLEMVCALPGADRAPAPLAKALNAIGVVADWQSDIAGAQKALNRALVIRQEVDDELGVAEVLGNLGNAALDAGDFDRAETLLAQSLPLYQSNGKTFWFGETLLLLGHTVRARGEYDRSAEYHEAAVAVLRELPGQNKLGEALLSLGWAELVRGDVARSRVAYREGLAVAQAGNDRMRLGRGVCGAAGLAGVGGDPVRAAQLFAAAAAQRDEEQILLKPTIQAEHDRLIARVRDALGEAAFASVWSDAYALNLEEAVEVATVILADPGESLSPDRAAAEVMAIELPAAIADSHGPLRLALELGLTMREVEVLHLVASGWADKEIATTLAISRHTASKHVAALRAKLHAPSRTGAVAAAREAGLL